MRQESSQRALAANAANIRHALDPREWLLQHPGSALLLLALLWAIFAVGNVLAPRGAILEDALVNPNDPHRQMDEHVHSLQGAGFRGQADRVSFVLYFDPPIATVADLDRIQAFTNRVRNELGDPVTSLSTYPRFVDDGEEIRSDPHVPVDLREITDIEEWKR